jgi:Putative addiction module component
MMQDAQELLKKALALSVTERADLAGRLIASLDETFDEDAEAAWQQERSVVDSKRFDLEK